MSKEPKRVWLVYRDTIREVRSTREVHSIWSTEPLALVELQRLAQRHKVACSLETKETGLFKVSAGYAGFTVEYKEVDVT